GLSRRCQGRASSSRFRTLLLALDLAKERLVHASLPAAAATTEMVKDLAVEPERGLYLERRLLWTADSRLGELVDIGEKFAGGDRPAEHFLGPFRVIRVFDARHCRVSFPSDWRSSD